VLEKKIKFKENVVGFHFIIHTERDCDSNGERESEEECERLGERESEEER
jgi:hypothetical protein